MFLLIQFIFCFLELVTLCCGTCSPSCSVTGWGPWSNCSLSGTKSREKSYCCPQGITDIDQCLKNCSITRENPASQACTHPVDGCQIVSWTEWTSCEDGYNCVQGERIKKAGICCDLNENLNHCKNRCNMTTADVTVKALGPSDAFNYYPANGPSHLSGNNTAVEQAEGGANVGVIAGAVIGVLALAGLSGFLAFFLYRRWKKKEESKVRPDENGSENVEANPNTQKSVPQPA